MRCFFVSRTPAQRQSDFLTNYYRLSSLVHFSRLGHALVHHEPARGAARSQEVALAHGQEPLDSGRGDASREPCGTMRMIPSLRPPYRIYTLTPILAATTFLTQVTVAEIPDFRMYLEHQIRGCRTSRPFQAIHVVRPG